MTTSILSMFRPRQDGATSGEDPQSLYIHFEPVQEGNLYPLYTTPAHDLKPIAVGLPSDDPKDTKGTTVAALLDEMTQFLERYLGQSLNSIHISARELCTMRKTPGEQCAIPHRALWPNLGFLLKHQWVPIRTKAGFPLKVLNAYRPPDYNKAVGGAPRSLHINAAALDLIPYGNANTTQNRFRLAYIACEHHIQSAETYKSGLGVYGHKDSPSDIHVDCGIRKKPETWELADYFISKSNRPSSM